MAGSNLRQSHLANGAGATFHSYPPEAARSNSGQFELLLPAWRRLVPTTNTTEKDTKRTDTRDDDDDKEPKATKFI